MFISHNNEKKYKEKNDKNDENQSLEDNRHSYGKKIWQEGRQG